MQAVVAKGNGANVLNAAQPPGPVRLPRVARLAPTLGLLRGAGSWGLRLRNEMPAKHGVLPSLAYFHTSTRACASWGLRLRNEMPAKHGVCFNDDRCPLPENRTGMSGSNLPSRDIKVAAPSAASRDTTVRDCVQLVAPQVKLELES